MRCDKCQILIWLVIAFIAIPFFLFIIDSATWVCDKNGIKYDNVGLQLLTMVGTVGAVVVALFKDAFWRYWDRAVLDVVIENKPLYIMNIPQDEGGNAIYLRLKVENKGRAVANNVAVLMSSLSGVDIYGNKVECLYDIYLNASNLGNNSRPYPNVQSKTSMYWDFGLIVNPEYRKNYKQYSFSEELKGRYGGDVPAVAFAFTYKLPIRDYVVGPGRYLVELFVTADQIKAVKRIILIDTSRFIMWPNKSNEKFSFEKKREREEVIISRNIEFSVQGNRCPYFRRKSLNKNHCSICGFICKNKSTSAVYNKMRMEWEKDM